MPRPHARTAALLCMVLFLAQPIQFGIWLSRISEVQAVLGLSKSDLAFALLGMPLGLLPTLYFAGGAIDRFGVRRALVLAFPAMLVAGVLPGLAGGALGLFLGLMVLGACFAFAEVGLNVQAAQTERALGVAIMNRAHGFWSLGVMTGSLVGVRLANFELNAFWSLALGGGVLLPLLIAVSLRLPAFDAAEERSQQSADPWRLPAGLVPIILVVFGATIAEGAMNDWATVYMREASWGGTARDGLAVSVFAGMVTLGRFAGDGICVRSGAVALARTSLVLAIAGVAVLIGASAMWQAIVGFGLVGLGVSTIFPLGVSATARLSPTNQARSVSVMTFGALSGFLIGPPMIGLVAEAAGMRIGFAVLVPGLVMSLALAARLADRPKA